MNTNHTNSPPKNAHTTRQDSCPFVPISGPNQSTAPATESSGPRIHTNLTNPPKNAHITRQD